MQNNETLFDFIVIGSGPAGVMAAQTLVASGMHIAMIDVGNTDNLYQHQVSDTDFGSIRNKDEQQEHFLLGEQMESIPNDSVKVGAQLSPSRKAMIKDVQQWLPMVSDTFTPMESLGKGGLGAGWGLGAYVYSDAELQKASLNKEEMHQAYDVIAERIGISVGNDDISDYLVGNIKHRLSALKMDQSILRMQEKYRSKKVLFKKENIFFGAPSMAFLSEDYKDRKSTKYHDMDFYADIGKSAWRAQFVVDELKKEDNFQYIDRQLALRFFETESQTELECINIVKSSKSIFKCNKLIIATGPLGSARLLMRSQEKVERLPLLCNPYTYMPGINISMLGKPLDKLKTSMAQAMMIYDTNGKHDDLVSVALYTYRSLMLFRLINESPLGLADSRPLFQYLQSAFVIAGIHHPDSYSEDKYLMLMEDDKSPTGDHLFASYHMNSKEKSIIRSREKKIKKALRKMGVFPIKRMDPGAGSSIHYAGTIPFSQEEKLGTQATDGRLHGTKNVYIADASGFTYLPAKGITLSLMANAHRVVNGLLTQKNKD